MEDDDLVVSPLEAEERPESTVDLERLIDERLPLVELSELLIEVDGWTRLQRRLRARRRDASRGAGTCGATSMRRSWPRRATSA